MTVRDPAYATITPEVPSVCDLAYNSNTNDAFTGATAWQPYPTTPDPDRLVRADAGEPELCPITSTQ